MPAHFCWVMFEGNTTLQTKQLCTYKRLRTAGDTVCSNLGVQAVSGESLTTEDIIQIKALSTSMQNIWGHVKSPSLSHRLKSQLLMPQHLYVRQTCLLSRALLHLNSVFFYSCGQLSLLSSASLSSHVYHLFFGTFNFCHLPCFPLNHP